MSLSNRTAWDIFYRLFHILEYSCLKLHQQSCTQDIRTVSDPWSGLWYFPFIAQVKIMVLTLKLAKMLSPH